MKTLIIIPTYNEAENIELIIKAIFAQNIDNLDILIIDDNSPDKTAKIVKQLQKQYSNLYLSKRSGKLGLGSAYIHGFQKALKHKYNFVFEMDADFSHDPSDIIKLLNAAKKNNGLAIGSRRVKGGKIVGWNWWRHLSSFGANIISKFLLNIKTKDATAGFRCYTRQALQKIDFDKISGQAYSFQEELVFVCEKENIPIAEVPVTFKDRKAGRSKLGKDEIIEFFTTIFKLKIKQLEILDLLFFFFIIFLILFRLHNAFAFNPYWGYDGGGHLDYIFSISEGKGIPSIEDNYIAWHEPLYYFITGFYHKIVSFFSGGLNLKWLSLLQTIISLATFWISYKLIKLLTQNKLVILLSTISLNLFPAIIEASVFTTNELLNYFFIFLILYLFFKNFIHNKPTKIHYITIGIVFGFALLTKITAIILLILFLFYQFAQLIKQKNKTLVISTLLSLIIIAIIITPWQIYRHQNVLSTFSVNNYQFLEPKPIQIDERINFYTRVDTDIFEFPYWYSGSNSFWSMLYADSFYDYYGILQNKDLLTATDKQNITNTTANGNFVTKTSLKYSKKLVWFGFIPFVLMLLGLASLISESLKKNSIAFYSLVVFLSFLSAAIYYSYRYFYPESGVVKSIFIYPVYIFPIIYGFRAIKIIFQSYAKYVYAVTILLFFTYWYYLIHITWLTKYNY